MQVVTAVLFKSCMTYLMHNTSSWRGWKGACARCSRLQSAFLLLLLMCECCTKCVQFSLVFLRCCEVCTCLAALCAATSPLFLLGGLIGEGSPPISDCCFLSAAFVNGCHVINANHCAKTWRGCLHCQRFLNPVLQIVTDMHACVLFLGLLLAWEVVHLRYTFCYSMSVGWQGLGGCCRVQRITWQVCSGRLP